MKKKNILRPKILQSKPYLSNQRLKNVNLGLYLLN